MAKHCDGKRRGYLQKIPLLFVYWNIFCLPAGAVKEEAISENDPPLNTLHTGVNPNPESVDNDNGIYELDEVDYDNYDDDNDNLYDLLIEGVIELESFESLKNIFSKVSKGSYSGEDDDGDDDGNDSTRSPPLGLVFVYDHSCEPCQATLKKFDQVHELVREFFDLHSVEFQKAERMPPVLAKLDARRNPNTPKSFVDTSNDNDDLDDDDDAVINPQVLGLGIKEVPSFFFMTESTVNKQFLLLEYVGRLETAEDIFRTILHYYNRLMLTGEEIVHTDNLVNVKPRHFSKMADLQGFMVRYQHLLVHAAPVEFAIPPQLSSGERDYLRWLLKLSSSNDRVNNDDDEKDEDDSADDEDEDDNDFILFVQCRPNQKPNVVTPKRIKTYLDTFDNMSRVTSGQRNRAYLSIGDDDHDKKAEWTEFCSEEKAGSVVAWRIPKDFDLLQDWSKHLSKAIFLVETVGKGDSDNDNYSDKEEDAASERLQEFLVKISSPSCLWFDRQATAPIAFPLHRQVHAVLFIDFTLLPNHHFPPPRHLQDGNDRAEQSEQQWSMRSLVSRFRRACRDHKKNTFHRNDDVTGGGGGGGDVLEKDMVCLIIPSTETRVLVTFGIDPWTAADEAIDNHRTSSNHKTTKTTLDDVLPTLLITDQRSIGGMKRYYLQAPNLVRSKKNEEEEEEDDDENEHAISTFLSEFWQGTLVPSKPKVSTRRHSRTNEYGVRILSGPHAAAELWEGPSILTTDHQEEDAGRSSSNSGEAESRSHSSQQQQQQHHALVFFTASSCGHCKRFSVLYNRLAALIAQLEWTSILTLYQVDVATDELMMDHSYPWQYGDDWVLVRRVPDLYYLSPKNHQSSSTSTTNATNQTNGLPKKFVRYTTVPPSTASDDDDRGRGSSSSTREGVGKLRDVMEIVEWWLRVADMDNDEVRRLLLSLEKYEDKDKERETQDGAEHQDDGDSDGIRREE